VYWILAAFVLLLTLTVPALRPAGIVGCVILAGLLLWGMVQRWNATSPADSPVQERGAPASPAATRVPIPVESVVLEGARLTGAGAPFELRGAISNREASAQLRAFTILIVRKDCHQAALDQSGCDTLWQTRQWVDLTVPPGETRQFAVSIWAHGTSLRARGSVQDEMTIVSATGEPAPPQVD
jgi:hypothetical protein